MPLDGGEIAFGLFIEGSWIGVGCDFEELFVEIVFGGIDWMGEGVPLESHTSKQGAFW